VWNAIQKNPGRIVSPVEIPGKLEAVFPGLGPVAGFDGLTLANLTRK
jgi:hypothetical protein